MVDSSRIKAFLRISRANLLMASIGHATLGLFLGAGSLEDLIYVGVPLYILLHYSIAFLACNVNCLYDYEVDKRYKRYMSDSVDIFGKKSLKTMIFIEIFGALILIGYFFLAGHFIAATAGLIGIFGALAYSAEPIRIKKRGFASPMPILLLYTLPLIGGWFIYKDTLEMYFVIFLVGYVLMNEGYTLVNMCEDYSEDKEEGISTWAHIFGLKDTLKLAYVFAICGILSGLGLGIKFFQNFSGVYSIPAFISILFASILIFQAAMEVGWVRKGKDLKKSSKRYGKRLQRWFMMTRYPLMAATILLLL
jgi:4-hydroxybenzoate polyprenyltransferase